MKTKIFCLSLILFFNLINPSFKSFAAVIFPEDTIISLSGIDNGDLYIKNGSECESLNIDGYEINIFNISSGNNFTFKTNLSNEAFIVSPSENNTDLILDSRNIVDGEIISWKISTTEEESTSTFSLQTNSVNSWFAIYIDDVFYNSYQSNSLGVLTFTYTGLLSNAVFRTGDDNTPPSDFDLISPENNSISQVIKQTFIWNNPDDPDIDSYNLYLNNRLVASNINTNSYTLNENSSCDSNIWYIQAVDNAGNTTNSEEFVYKINCGNGVLFNTLEEGNYLYAPGFIPEGKTPRQQIIYPDGKIIYLDELNTEEEETTKIPNILNKIKNIFDIIQKNTDTTEKIFNENNLLAEKTKKTNTVKNTKPIKWVEPSTPKIVKQIVVDKISSVLAKIFLLFD